MIISCFRSVLLFNLPSVNTPLLQREVYADAVQLPVEADNESVISENEEYPGEDVVKVVNSKGESATLYKLADGRYMDRINRVFIYDGADTWTDTDEIIWSRAAEQ